MANQPPAFPISDRQGSHSLEELLWLSEGDARMLDILKGYHEMQKAQEAKEKEQRYNVATKRIIDNVILNLHTNLGCLPSFIYIDDFDHHLKLLLVFRKADFKAKGKDICTMVQTIQKLAIRNEGRDFQWSAMSDEGFEYHLPLEEFHKSLTLKTK